MGTWLLDECLRVGRVKGLWVVVLDMASNFGVGGCDVVGCDVEGYVTD